jgi:hypothetical protein
MIGQARHPCCIESWRPRRSGRRTRLDFSTLQARAAACGREIEFKREFAPDVYTSLAEVRSPDGRGPGGGLGQPAHIRSRSRGHERPGTEGPLELGPRDLCPYRSGLSGNRVRKEQESRE